MIRVLLLFFLFGHVASCHADAFADGKNFGSGGAGMVSGYISESSGAAIVPGYTVKGSGAVEAGYFQGGNGALSGLGLGKAVNCATGPRSTDPAARSECDAVNFVSGSKDQCDQLAPQVNLALVPTKKQCEVLDARRYVSPGLQGADWQWYVDHCAFNPAMQAAALTQYVRLNCDDLRTRQIPKIPANDPIAINAKLVTSNPDSVIAAAPGSGLSLSNGYYTGCQTVTNTRLPALVTDSCFEYRATVIGASCTEARTVVVDPGAPPVPEVPCSDDGKGHCVGGSPAIPAVAPKVVQDDSPAPCQAYAPDGTNVSSCRTRTVCTDGPSTRTYGWDGSLHVYHDCWAWSRDYGCETPLNPPLDNCQGLRDKGCVEVSQSCSESNIDGGCVAYKHEFQCSKPGSTTTVLNCKDRKYCLDGNCFDAGSPVDADFTNAVVGKEALREAGIYQDGGKLFNGKDDRCEKWPARCCSGGGGGFSMTNRAIMGAASQAYHLVGSSYMYDALFASDAPSWVLKGFEFVFESSGFNSGIGGLVAGDIAIGNLTVESFMETMVPGWWTIAIMAYQWLMSCDQEATITAMKKDTGLCVDLGEYCSRKLPIFGICIQRKKTYCCFNSKLAKIINQEGKRQLGRSNGSAENPDCSGLTPDDFNYVDFSRAAPGTWDEFVADIKPTMPNAGNAVSQVGTTLPTATQTIRDKYKNYYTR